MEQRINMIEECTERYHVKESDKGGVEISIKVPKRFENLWLIKLSDLTTTEKEIEEMQ